MIRLGSVSFASCFDYVCVVRNDAGVRAVIGCGIWWLNTVEIAISKMWLESERLPANEWVFV